MRKQSAQWPAVESPKRRNRQLRTAGRRGQAVSTPSSCETRRETFSEITTIFDGEFTALSELIQTTTGPEQD
ncbi:hypothetical protein E2C01_030205 [Portunus trituberculatus]|uniref:Uncharacterized protein n=1 Tax=Portunus trituberculatus TaxID=210409 RepID=A0A5B7EU98_PORTR|nr:hypothetical protein [Portunus trituberculatus]